MASSTQDSVAVRGNGPGWFLLNASPDVLRQIEGTRELHPAAPRHSPVQGVVLTNGDLDHVLGLFSLRESHPLVLYATASVRDGLLGNAIVRTLERFPEQLRWHVLELGRETELVSVDGTASGVFVTPIAAEGKLPVHLVGHRTPSPEDNVGLVLRGRDGGRAVYLAAAASLSGIDLAPGPGDGPGAMAGDVLFMDGTFWSEDELVTLGLGKARARDMAHMPVGGPGGSLAALVDAPFGRKIYTHINNTNPMLRPGSPERAAVEGAGWEIAYDGMDVAVAVEGAVEGAVAGASGVTGGSRPPSGRGG